MTCIMHGFWHKIICRLVFVFSQDTGVREKSNESKFTGLINNVPNGDTQPASNMIQELYNLTSRPEYEPYSKDITISIVFWDKAEVGFTKY